MTEWIIAYINLQHNWQTIYVIPDKKNWTGACIMKQRE